MAKLQMVPNFLSGWQVKRLNERVDLVQVLAVVSEQGDERYEISLSCYVLAAGV